MPGFFTASQLTETRAPTPLVPRCGSCGLYKTCKSPKMPVTGQGQRRILLLGEAPGRHEDERNKQFVGETGQLLQRTIAKFGVDMRKDCWLTNSLICRPPGNDIPKNEMIAWCRPNLLTTLRKLQPDLIIPLGGVAVESLIGHFWKEDVGGIMRWAGFHIPCQKINAWICPTYHPSYVAREKKNPVVELIWRRHLKAALKHSGKPWGVVPDYKSRVKLILDPTDAAYLINKIIKLGGPIAFDYESTSLKPDGEGEIVSCAVAYRETGSRAIAFPWYGDVIPAVRRLLSSNLPKYGHNIKHEERWTIKIFGVPVRNWKFCSMVGAHTIDTRPGITSLKFQAFALLGEESYDDHIKPHLKAKKGSKINRILEEVELKKLLLYNGLDALHTFDVAEKQMEHLGVK